MFNQLALLLYSIVYIPQFFLIWNNKSSKGISLSTILLWSQADFISLAGSIFLHLDLNIIIIEWYHSIIGILMSLFCLLFSHYTFSTKLKLTIPIIIFAFINIVLCSIFQQKNKQSILIGEILGWITSFIYIFGRFPQIYKNWYEKSTNGLSIAMYVLTIYANGFYLLSIYESNNGNTSIYIPWITLIIFSIILDFFVLIQWYKYKKYDDIIDEYKMDDYNSDNSSETNTP